MCTITPVIDGEYLLEVSSSTVLAEAMANARALEEERFLRDGGISDSYRAECKLVNVLVGHE